jgi:hypothetical protein
MAIAKLRGQWSLPDSKPIALDNRCLNPQVLQKKRNLFDSRAISGERSQRPKILIFVVDSGKVSHAAIAAVGDA